MKKLIDYILLQAVGVFLLMLGIFVGGSIYSGTINSEAVDMVFYMFLVYIVLGVVEYKIKKSWEKSK